MDRRTAAAIIFGILTPLSVARAEDPTPATTQDVKAAIDQEREKELRQQENNVRFYPQVKFKRVSDVFTITIEKQDLVLRTMLAPTEADVRLMLDNAKKTVIVASAVGVQAQANQPYVPSQFKYIHDDYSNPSTIASNTSINLAPGSIQISRDVESDVGMRSVSLIQSGQYVMADDGDENKVRLFVSDKGDNPSPKDVDLKLAAKSFVDLRQRYPAETTKYLEPILQELGQAALLFYVDSRSAWQVFGAAAPAAPEMHAQVSELLKQLDADSPKSREEASRALDRLGQPAATLLLKMNRDGWTDEQASRVDTFLAPYKPLSEEDVNRLSTDIDFLSMTLTAEDPTLRALAFDALKKIAKQPITFDLNADAPTRMASAIQLRDSLRPPTTASPTEPPATAPNAPAPETPKKEVPAELRDAAP